MELIDIVGAGGIGCAVGYVLCAAGARVRFVDADQDKIHWGRRHGVGLDKRQGLPAEFQTFDDWTPQPGATILLCTKCYDNAQVLARLPSRVRLIPIQNGFDPAVEVHGEALEGIASFVSECSPQRTHTRLTRGGRLHFGSRGTPTNPVPPPFIALLQRAPFRVTQVADILPYKYSKLMYNAAISPLAAAAGLDNGQLLAVPKARRLFFELLLENYTILHQAGIPLGTIGPFHPDTVARILRRRIVANALAWAFYPSLRGSYCSMSGDLPRGRTEIDYYNRHLIDLAGERPCPLNRRVVALVKGMEQGRLQPGLDRLDELL